MRCLRRSSAVRLRGSPSPQPRRPLGRLHPSRHGSSPERDKSMIMDHDIAMDDCAALKLREGASLLPQEPDSMKISEGTGKGLPPPLSPGFRNANASPTGATATPRRCASAVRRSTSEQEIMPMVASVRFHRHAQGGRDLPVADEQFRDRRVARPIARRPARGIRRRIHRHPLRACRPG